MLTRSFCRSGLWVALATTGLAGTLARADDPNAPLIVQQPVSQTVCVGSDVYFNVVATGPNLTYQWRRDTVPIDGATSDVLALADVGADDEGGYDVVVSNAHGSITSDTATLSVDTGPVILEDPVGQTVCAGAVVTLTVVASGLDLGYQWRKDDEPIAGATSDSLVIDPASVEDSGDYDVVVTSPCGAGVAYSAAATVVVDAGPEIVEHPVSQEVCAGARVVLHVTVSNQAGSCVDEIGSTASSGSGARMRGNYYRVDTSTTLTRIEHYLSISTPGMLVFYVYEAQNLSGPYALIMEDTVPESGTGQGYYASNPLSVALQAGRYYIIGAAWPDAHTYYWNESHPDATAFGASLRGFAYAYQYPLPDPPPTPTNSFAYMQRLTTSDLALTYQWRKDDVEIPGASGPELTIAAMSAADAGDYDVVVTNACGQAVSESATLTLVPGPTITQQPVSQAVCAGEPALFTVVAQGPGLTYQWRVNGQNLPGATGDTYTIAAAESSHAGQYDVIVSNACGSVLSAAATLIVADGGPTILEQPAGQTVCAGDPFSLRVVAEGAGLEYQWRRDGQSISGAQAPVYTISAAAPGDEGDYDVVVTNPCGEVVSQAARLEVDAALSIAQQPEGGVICAGNDFTLQVVVSGTRPAYQWRRDGEPIPGACGSDYTIVAAVPADSGDYDVVITNACGQIMSDAVPVRIIGGPLITEHPADRLVFEGRPLTLTVALDPSSFPHDVDCVGQPIDAAVGANRIRGNSYAVSVSTTLTLIEQYLEITTSGELVFFVYEAQDGEQGPYSLILEDVVPQSGTGLKYFASHPLDVQLQAGRHYIIGAAWRGNHRYFWQQNGHPQATAFGQSVHGLATSYGAQLPTQPVPTSTNAYPQRLTTTQRVATYQWRKDGVAIGDATSATYVVAAAAPQDSGSYDVLVNNVCGTTVSEAAEVTVVPCDALGPQETARLDAPAAPGEAQPRQPAP